MLTVLKNWYQKITQNVDALELEQAILRLAITCAFLVYVFQHLFANTNTIKGDWLGLYYLLAYIAIGCGILISILVQKNTSVLRRLFGAWVDIIGVTLFMSLTADVGVVLVGVYLFVTFGNGFRYGKKYLYHSQALSIVGYFVAIQLSPYWKAHEAVGYSLLMMLIILPLYVAQLITRLNEAKLKAEQASLRAADANQAKTRFVANMSHEIRTPLNGIIGISTLFKTTPLNADQQDLLKTLESSSKLLLSLLNNVLDFTKIEARKFTIEHVAFSAEQALQDTLELYRTQAFTKGIQLGESVSEGLTNVKGDAFVLRQVLANLMGNAIKFTQQGSVTLSANVLQEDALHNENIHYLTVRFEVADTGVGIAEDKQHTIFDSFTQADASTTRKFGGSGLGLTIAKHMIEEMGGALKFHSVEDVGSRFWFDISLEKVVVAEAITVALTPAEDALLPKPIIFNQKPLNILVCEDESTNQKIITRLLSLPGHQVEIAENADEMLDALELRQFDLVITDLNMAGMSGAEALKLYRFTKPMDTNTRFILFTADASLSAKQTSIDAGFDAFLTKPIDAGTLFNTIERILNLAPSTADQWLNNALKVPVEIKSDLEANNTALDLATLNELEKIGAGDDLFMHRLLRNYLADSVSLIYKIETAVKQKQFGELHDYCHALKGNSLSIGAMQLSLTTEAIGVITAAVSMTNALDLLDKLNSDFASLTLAVEDYLRRPAMAQTNLAANKI